jgi:hypothetical protein
LLDNIQWTGKSLDDFLLMTPALQETSLFEVIGSTGCSVVLITSFTQCSMCRDRVLDQWKTVIKDRAEARIALVVSEGKPLTNNEMKESLVAARALDHNIPIFLDPKGDLVPFFEVSLDQTPLCVLVNSATKRIAWIHGANDPLPSFDQPFIALFKEIVQ